ncbi:hypothetical protein T06_2694 [Trichinella sp. T6]|nr:hypothetical protein T06_2694 [Trichinella sp. T6]
MCSSSNFNLKPLERQAHWARCEAASVQVVIPHEILPTFSASYPAFEWERAYEVNGVGGKVPKLPRLRQQNSRNGITTNP